MKKLAIILSAAMLVFSANAMPVESASDDDKPTEEVARVAAKKNINTVKKVNSAPKNTAAQKTAQANAKNNKKVTAGRTNKVATVVEPTSTKSGSNGAKNNSVKVTASAADKRVANKAANNRARTATKAKLKDLKKISEEIKEEK